jgi:Protein of unknown function, DUF600
MSSSAYQAMASIIAENCPPKFDMAWFDAELEDGVSQMQYWYESTGSRKQPEISLMQKSELDDVLHNLRDSMTVSGQKPWSKCKFTLFPDGKFKFDVEYDD